jgi:hypothetical protein
MNEMEKIERKLRSILGMRKPLDPLIKKLTPPKANNWNRADGDLEYVEQFSFYFINHYYPYILQNCREYGVDSSELSMLDIGCGWGPMAIPFTMNEISRKSDQRVDVGYLGIDIRKDAIDWLVRAYAEYPFIAFQHHQSDAETDYIGGEIERAQTHSMSNGDEAAFDIPEEFIHNVQWSSSVFTHLTPQACRRALEAIKKSSSKNSIQINTWLIVDDESKYALALGIADRKLPIDCGEYLTYSEKNPLVCTAYKIESIRNLYTNAGLEILKIERGAWRGVATRNAANHYQDIVISRPMGD